MKRIGLLLIGLFVLTAFANEKLIKVKLTEDISCLLPANFHEMSNGEIMRRLPSARKPLAAYTDESQMIEFSVYQSESRWAASDIKMAKEFYKSSIMHLYDKVEIVKEEIVTINKRQYAVFEFASLVKGDDLTKKAIRRYSYIQYTIKDGKSLVFGLSTPAQLQKKWQPTALQIMNSVKVK